MSCRSCQGWLIPHICGVAFPPRHSPAPEKTVKKPRVFGPFRTAPFTPAREHEVTRCQREPGSLRAWGLGVIRLNRPPRSAGLGALSVRCAMPVGGRLAGLRGSGCWIGIDKLASVKTRWSPEEPIYHSPCQLETVAWSVSPPLPLICSPAQAAVTLDTLRWGPRYVRRRGHCCHYGTRCLQC